MSEDLHLLGRLAVHYKLLTAEQLAETTRTQARTSDPRPLGELWIDAGWMTRAQLDKLLAVQREVLAKQISMLVNLMQSGRSEGMQLLDDALLDLVTRKIVTPRDAYMKAQDKSRFEPLLEKE